MNKNGNPKTLVAAHPGNLNAATHGVYSERRIQPRAAEIFAEFVEAFEFSPAERLAVWEVARSTALLEAIDQALDESGLANKRGEAPVDGGVWITPPGSARAPRGEQWPGVPARFRPEA